MHDIVAWSWPNLLKEYNNLCGSGNDALCIDSGSYGVTAVSHAVARDTWHALRHIL
jgi:hypothetical protein